MRDSRDTKGDKAKKGDEDMAKTPENTNDIKTILGEGIKRYNKALEKLSKN